MKNNLLLKNLIDFLFILMVPGILGFIFILPFGVFTTSIGNVSVNSYEDVSNLPILYWMAIFTAIITYVMVLLSLWFMKKSARHFLDNNLLKEPVSKNLGKSGKFLIICAIGTLLSYLFTWVADLDGSGISLHYGNNIFVPLFLAIIGIFFKIIANTLNSARLLKEENDLTI